MTSCTTMTFEACVRRGTHQAKGRRWWLTPGESAMRQLHYGRIILAVGDAPAEFGTEGLETGLICLSGRARVEVAGGCFILHQYDALYLPRQSAVAVTPEGEGCDLAEVAAPVDGEYPLQFISYDGVRQDPTLHFRAGGPSSTRNLNILLGKNVQAGRICAGVTFSEAGNWTSWPPHEHARMLEEAYVYIAMPAPAWGIQLVYTDPKNPELAVIVREGDCVAMPAGYHPNVAAPGGSIGFLWMMAAHTEATDRQFGVVNVQPEYAAGGTGLEASQVSAR